MKVTVTDIRADVLDYCKGYPATRGDLAKAYGHSENSINRCIDILTGAGCLRAAGLTAGPNRWPVMQYLTTPRGEAALAKVRACREAA